MIYLTTINQSLQMDLAAAVTTTELTIVISSKQQSPTRRESWKLEHGVSTGVTALNIASAPVSPGEIHMIENVTIYNADSVAATVTINILDGATVRIMVKHILNSGEILGYGDSLGWYVL